MYIAIIQYVNRIAGILERQTSVDDCLRDTAREWDILLDKMSVEYRLYVNLHWSGDATREFLPISLDYQGVDNAVAKLEEAIRKCTSGSEIVKSIRNLMCEMYEFDDNIVFYSESRGYYSRDAQPG